jgi:hypothetical protein
LLRDVGQVEQLHNFSRSFWTTPKASGNDPVRGLVLETVIGRPQRSIELIRP